MMFFGRIPETHVKNLKSAPFIYFEGVKNGNLSYDLDTKSKNWFVRYDLIVDKIPDNLEKRGYGLANAIKMLFWKEVVVSVFIENNEVYKSE